MRFRSIVWPAALIVFAAIGIGAGWLIRGGGHADFRFDPQGAPYQAADLPGGRSKAGFTGFDDTGGLAGAPIIAGRITATDATSISVETATGNSVIRLSGQDRLRILKPYAGVIPNGATVVARMKPDSNDVAAVLAILDP